MNFWETKKLEELNTEEWELLCDGCAKCCLVRLEDKESGEVACTSLSCKLLDTQTCRCSNYDQRHEKVPECLVFTHKEVLAFRWLPSTCAYRLVAEGKPLPKWHPLISGSSETVHTHHISVRDKVISEEAVPESDVADYIIDWMD